MVINWFQFNSALSSAVHVLAMIMLAHFGSVVGWNIASPPAEERVRLISDSLQENAESQKVALMLLAYPLFGEPPKAALGAPVARKKPKRVTAAAPKVRLTVRGILSGKKKLAIIESGGIEETYAEGEYLSYLYISEIAVNYVAFDDDGERFVVFVEDDNVEVGGFQPTSGGVNAGSGQAPEASIGGEDVITPILDDKQRAALLSLRDTVRTNPLQAIGKINVSPMYADGKVSGFRVSPGTEQELFGAAGLRSGDILVSVNGKGLSEVNNLTSGMRLMNQLSTAEQLDLVVLRQGRQKRIYITLE